MLNRLRATLSDPVLRGAPAAALALLALSLGISAWLHWPLPLKMTDHHVIGFFHDGHVWCYDHMARMLTGQVPFEIATDRIGYPTTVEVRFISWGGAAIALPFRPLLGALGAYNAALLLSCPLAALAMFALIRKVGEAPAWTAAGASLAYAFCPYALGCVANGQAAKFQHWTVPLYLLAFSYAAIGPRRLLGLIGIPLVTWATAFTAPSYALQVPMLAGLWMLWGFWAGRRTWAWSVPCALAALGLTAWALFQIEGYYDYSSQQHLSAFANATPPPLGELLSPPQFAQPEETFLGETPIDVRIDKTNHVTYVGLPLLILCGLLSIRRFPGRLLGWACAIAGIVISLGPRLASEGALVTNADGMEWVLPAQLLETYEYPIVRSGQYYRMILMASLGLSLMLGGGLARLRPFWGGLLAWLLGFGAVADGIRSTWGLWPRPVVEIPGVEDLRAMAEDPAEGAVLHLPLRVSDAAGGTYLLLGLLHERRTTALPRDVMDVPTVDFVEGHVQFALQMGAPEASQWLLDKGFRYVLWTPWFQYAGGGANFDSLKRGLGEPTERGGLTWWRLDGEPSED